MNYQSHRWEYKPDHRGHECVPPALPSLVSDDRCHGCGMVISDEDLYEAVGNDLGAIKSAMLNLLAARFHDEIKRRNADEANH